MRILRTAIRSIGAFACLCVREIAGVVTASPTPAPTSTFCTATRCKNGGSCIPGDTTCTCVNNFSGRTCSTAPICSPGSWLNAGVCQACPVNKTSPLGSTSSSACVDPTDGIIGCFTDCTNSSRDLPVDKIFGSSNTYARCAAQCAGYIYFGVQYGEECRCGNSYGSMGVPVARSSTACNVNCSGDTTKYCGGECTDTIGLVDYFVPKVCSEGSFMNAGVCQACPLDTTSPLGSTSSSACVAPTDGIIGCFTDCTNSSRDLPVDRIFSSSNTYASCAAQCATYKYFGVEYGEECRCGDSYSSMGVPVARVGTACNVNCSGDSSKPCGGACTQTIGLVANVAPKVPVTYQCASGFVIYSITLRSGTGLNAISSYKCMDASGNYKNKTVGVGDISGGTSVTVKGPFSAFNSGFAVSPNPTDAASGLVFIKTDGTAASSTPPPPYGTVSTGVTTKKCSSGQVLYGFSLVPDSSGTMVGGKMTAKCRAAATAGPTPTPTTK